MNNEYDYKKLYRHCRTTNEELVVKCLDEGVLSSRKISKATGIKSKSTVLRIINRLESRAALHGYAPEYDMDKETPESHLVKGVSSLYRSNGENGEPILQWVKTDKNRQKYIEALETCVETLKEEVPVLPQEPKQNALRTEIDLLNLHVIADYHLGLFTWADENGGEDWDSEKAERYLIDWFQKSLDMAPPASTGVFCNLGDFLHTDGEVAETPKSKNVLDMDSPYQKTIRTAMRLIRQMVEMMRQKYDRVHIINVSGNHDRDGGKWLREVFSIFYEGHHDVTVDTTADRYHAYEFGNVSLFFHHGDLRKTKDLPTVFTSKFRDIFGRTTKSYGHSGHLHHSQTKENGLMIMEQHNTLAPSDSHASSHGYVSQRKSSVISYHRQYGEVIRTSVPSEVIGLD